MEQNKNVPVIRFNGFEDEWNEIPFGNIAQVRRGLTYSPKDIRKNGVKVLRSSNINEDRFCEYDNDVYVDGNAINIDFVKNNDILITAANGSSRLVGKHALINTSHDKVVHGGFMLLASSKNPFFLNASMSSEWYRKFISKNIAGGNGAIGNLNKNHLESEVILIPKEPEQTQIGNFFKTLDSQITSQEQKSQKLVNLKKAMLKKMFPKEGADVPEIRFKGFTEKWEEKLVGDYYGFKNGLNKGKEFFGYGTPIVNFTDVYHNRSINFSTLKGKVFLNTEEIKNFKVQKGDLFFTRTSETILDIGFNSVMIDDPKDTVFSGFVLRGRSIDEDPLVNKFKRYVFFTDEFRNEMIKKSSMTTRALTSGTAIKKMVFKFPANKSEQQKIGEYFEKLDNLIQQSQEQIKKYKNIKKALLQKMFV
ncbi:restriction endonuclease subunit S [Myroides odoratimimus]|uniref:restriction endonuclease subunit S n=1 Tax=Myroides odoratimimus TaxID=76832 RepID=UPI0025755AC1|nr:restriction endonuclease subunit S [Myroides odoratimimus]MDM1412448.1 restriction endonuclease subunit S [Myroides odoratimimus]MEC4007707.1 restriction endonuclease subunit S [Myroides odoratimimus]MEC4084638.1 restriction endonuclease subunit S [Myroides odoratimimus]